MTIADSAMADARPSLGQLLLKPRGTDRDSKEEDRSTGRVAFLAKARTALFLQKCVS